MRKLIASLKHFSLFATLGSAPLRHAYVRYACCLIATLTLVLSAFAEKMTFKYMDSEVRSMPGSIEADGDIVTESAAELESYLNARGVPVDGDKYTVVLNSPGGDLFGGMKLGEFIRKHHYNTAVYMGSCASACAIAFIGGVERGAGNGVLGVHQFYQASMLENPSAKLFNGLDMSAQQLVSSLLVDYAFRMGVDARFVAIA